MEREYKILSEIKEQQQIAKLMFNREHEKEMRDAVALIQNSLNENGEIFLVGSGSSYHAAVYASHLFAKNNHFIANAIQAGDFDNYVPDMGRNELVIMISQAGNNPVLLESFHHLVQRDVKTLLITNDFDSPLGNRADLVLPLEISREEAVPATKSYFSSLVIFSLISEALIDGSALFRLKDKIIGEIKRISSQDYYEKFAGIAKYLAHKNDLYVLGEGASYANAMEAALKLKECAQLSAEAYISSEFLHGPITMLKRGTPVMILTGEKDEEQKEIAEKIKRAGGAIIVVGPRDIPGSEAFIPVADLHIFTDLISIVPLQLLAYKTALVKNLNPDKPKGLEKIVEI